MHQDNSGEFRSLTQKLELIHDTLHAVGVAQDQTGQTIINRINQINKNMAKEDPLILAGMSSQTYDDTPSVYELGKVLVEIRRQLSEIHDVLKDIRSGHRY